MVVPVWEPIRPNRPEWIIKMDPGPAFGIDQHANLILGTILKPAPFFAPRLDPDSRLVLSGSRTKPRK